MDEAVSETFNR